MNVDVAVVGGGIMGAALAYWLTRLEPTLDVVVIERDPTYARASSALSAASIRQQFTTAVNVRISQASIAFLRDVDAQLSVAGERVDLGLREGGYLYVAHASGADSLRAAHAVQVAHGADVVLLDAAGLAARFPWLRTDDLALGSLGLRGEGWFDAYALLRAFLAKARAQGARIVRGEVVGMLRPGGAEVGGVELHDGATIRAPHVVNAAGPWARKVARLAGIDLPVRARRRTVYVLSCPVPMPRFPLLIDPSGFWIRPEGACYIAGLPPDDDADDLPLEPEYGAFDARLWPALAARVPAFEAARLERAWAGYYEVNTFDHNGLLGTLPERPTLWFCNGFSGHGMQQAPVVTRGLAERILYGGYRTLDLAELDVARLREGRAVREANVIG